MSLYRTGIAADTNLGSHGDRAVAFSSGVADVRIAEKRFYQRGIGLGTEPQSSSLLDGVVNFAQDVAHILLLFGGAWTAYSAFRGSR